LVGVLAQAASKAAAARLERVKLRRAMVRIVFS
jgi:hypothetical protein